MPLPEALRPAVLLVGLVWASTALAQGEPAPDERSLRIEAGVDVYYGANFNRPADRQSFLPGLGTSAKRAGELSLNLATLGARLAPAPVGFVLLLGVGTSMDVVHAGEPSGVAVGLEPWRFVQQASVQWAPTPRLLLEAGVYPSHIGLESFQSQLNWHYTRGWMGELSPYYQTGLKLAYQVSEQWSAQLHLLNGWQVIGDNNRAKAVGTQLAWSDGRTRVALNGFAGPELPGDEARWRLFADLLVTLRVTPALQLALAADAGRQDGPARAAPARWSAAGLHARYAFSDALALAARAELFDDGAGGISGTRQTLVGGTLTLEARPAARLVLKLEARHDRSTADGFSSSVTHPDGTPVPTDHQTLLVLGATATY